jgi:AAA family ATP:ADP antiporter
LVGELRALPSSLPAWKKELARAIASQRAAEQLPFLISLLGERSGREEIEGALVTFGREGLAALGRALEDRHTPRRVRANIPAAVARFGSRAAIEHLLETIEGDADGFVRYRALRALGRLVAESALEVDRGRVERLAASNLVEYFRLLGLRQPFSKREPRSAAVTNDRDRTEDLLVGLVDDKLRQSLARVFRLLKIAHPREDLHRVHDAYLTDDRVARANAAELVASILHHRDQTRLRELLRISGEELRVQDAVERAIPFGGARPPGTRDQALALLMADKDSMLAGLARLHAAAASGQSAHVEVDSLDVGAIDLGLEARPPLGAEAGR